jgi:hypothetical protein
MRISRTHPSSFQRERALLSDKIPIVRYKQVRDFLILPVTGGYAVYCAYRILGAVSEYGKISDEFRPEYVGYLMFWVLAPPLWFFLEFYAAEQGCFSGLFESPEKKADALKMIKDYSDFASKIWAAVAAMLLVLATR